MHMIAEALQFLADLKSKSLAPQELPGDVRTFRRVIDGRVHEWAVKTALREHEPACLADLIRLAVRFGPEPDDEPGEDRIPASPVVWYDECHVVLVLNDTGHRDQLATLTLAESDVFARLAEIRRTREWFEQKAFVRLLRVELAGTLEPVALLEKVRKLRWENGVTTSGHVTRQQESLGREIQSKVSAEGELPEEVTLLVPVYKTPGEAGRLPLRCTVDADPALGKLQLLPLPDEVERVRALAVQSIGMRLVAGLPETIPAYYGRP